MAAHVLAVCELINQLYEQCEAADANSHRCKALGRRCMVIKGFLEELVKSGSISKGNKSFDIAIENLREAIKECQSFVRKFSGKDWRRKVLNFAWAKAISEEFDELHGQLTQISSDLQLGIGVSTLKQTSVRPTVATAAETVYSAGDFAKDDEENLHAICEMLESNGVEVRELVKNSDTPLHAITALESQLPNYNDLYDRVASLMNLNDGGSSASPKTAGGGPSGLNLTQLQWDKSDSGSILGRGSFGAVYRGVYKTRPVAVKCIEAISSLSESEQHQLAREASILQLAHHKNIIKFVGMNLDAGLVVTELAVFSLQQALYSPAYKEFVVQNSATVFTSCTQAAQTSSDIPSIVKLQWLHEISQGLQYLHFHNIVHRDLKPGNILLVPVHLPAGTSLIAKISDFGVSTVVGLSSTHRTVTDGGLVGSQVYMAPELILNAGVTAASSEAAAALPRYSNTCDIYSFGILGNELYLGRPPWEGLSALALVRQLDQKRRPVLFEPRLDSGNDDTSAAEKQFCRESMVMDLVGNSSKGCLAEDPASRPTAKEITLALSEALSENPAALRSSSDEELEDWTRTVLSSKDSAVAISAWNNLQHQYLLTVGRHKSRQSSRDHNFVHLDSGSVPISKAYVIALVTLILVQHGTMCQLQPQESVTDRMVEKLYPWTHLTVMGSPLGSTEPKQPVTRTFRTCVAQYFLGHMRYFGIRLPQKDSSAEAALKYASKEFAVAKHLLGLFRLERESPPNTAEGLRLLLESCQQGNALSAAYLAARCLREDDTFFADFQGNEAFSKENLLHFLNEAVDGFRCIRATTMLGLLYYKGKFESEDFAAAAEFFRRAVEPVNVDPFGSAAFEATYRSTAGAGPIPAPRSTGFTPAHYMRGVLLFNGKGCEQNYKEAYEQFSRALASAESDLSTGTERARLTTNKMLPISKYFLGVYYEKGIGGAVRKDAVKARQLYQEALDGGYDKAAEKLDGLK